MPIPKERIKFVAAYQSSSTLLIITIPIGMWCCFERHPAITCLGIVTSRPAITPEQLKPAPKAEVTSSSTLELELKDKEKDDYILSIKNPMASMTSNNLETPKARVDVIARTCPENAPEQLHAQTEDNHREFLYLQ